MGIPRYISQALAVTMYPFGFREGWLWVFPDHHALLVDLVAFVLLWAIAYKSADLAIRVQFVIMVVIIRSLVSIAIAAAQGSMTEPPTRAGLWGEFPGSEEYLASLVDLARIPGVRVHVHHGDFTTFARRAPVADLNLFGLPGEVDFRFVRRLVETTHSTCVFVRDSGEENVLA